MYISTKQFAEAAGLDRKSAARICKEAFESQKKWFGCQLDVKIEEGARGGNAGRRYMVSVASLPDLFRNMAPATGEPFAGRLTEVTKPASRLDHARTISGRDRRSRVIMERYTAIRHALGAQHGSEERRVRIAAAAVQARVSEATIYRWLADYAKRGLAGLGPMERRQPSPKMVVSRKFDSLFRQRNKDPEDKLKLIGEELDLYIKTMWTTRGSQAGMYAMSQDLSLLVECFCRRTGFDVDGIPCAPSIAKIRQYRDYSLVFTFLHHAEKRQNMLPRIQRTYVDVGPMEVVFVDVKLCDIFIYEGEGKKRRRFRPALIGFLDAGTGRLFAHMVKLARGGCVRKSDMVGALLGLITHPNWGVPRAIYTDNGSEMFGLIDGLTELAGLGYVCPVIRAQDYNPQAKPIEGLFGNLNRQVFSRMEGFTGGKRKKLRRHPAQKAAEPYPRTWEAFCNELGVLLADYHGFRRQRGLSPDEQFERKVAAMDAPLRVLSYEDAVSLLGHLTSRVVRQGSVTVEGRRYTDPVLYPEHGKRLDLVLPPSGGHELSGSQMNDRLGLQAEKQEVAQPDEATGPRPHILDPAGQLFPASEDGGYGPLEHAGAVESEERKQETWQVVHRMLNEVHGCSMPPQQQLAAARNYLRHRAGGPPFSGGISAHARISPAEARAKRRAQEQARLDRRIWALEGQ